MTTPEEKKEEPRRSFVTQKDREEKGKQKKAPKVPVPKEKMPLFEKMDKIIEGQNVIAYQITRIADHLTGKKTQYDEEGKAKIEKAVIKEPVKTVKPPVKSTETITTPPIEVKKVMDLFPSELRSKLNFEQLENNVRISGKAFLGSEVFANVAGIIRDNGGVYKSAGKDSHFIVPFKEETMRVITETPAPPVEAPPTEDVPLNTIVKTAFPQDLLNLLVFDETDEYITIKPRQYLGSENFAKIASIVRELGGEYISAGKESHFRVEKK